MKVGIRTHMGHCWWLHDVPGVDPACGGGSSGWVSLGHLVGVGGGGHCVPGQGQTSGGH